MKEDIYTSEELALALEVLQYLQDYPEAKDTMEGIARWWLQRSPDLEMLTKIERAVSFLIFKDFVIETRRPGLPPYYRVNTMKQEQIRQLLDDSENK